jgi:hypothetical protein
MKADRVMRPDFDVEVGTIRAYLRVFLWRIWLFFTFPHKCNIDYMIGEKKIGENRCYVFPRIKIIYRRE